MKFEYDLIMIIMNKFTKKAYFVSFHEEMRAEKVAYLFEKHLMINHEVSAEIISDKNT